jgi:hypothetical protein
MTSRLLLRVPVTLHGLRRFFVAGVAMCTMSPSDETRQILEPLDVVGSKGGGSKKRGVSDQKPKIQKEKEKEKLKLKEETDLAVTRFFYECEIPLVRADDAAFKRMIRAVATYGEGYVPPDRDRLCEDPSRDALLRASMSDRPPGLLSLCAQHVRRDQEELVMNSSRMGATLVTDGAKNLGKSNSISYVLSTDKGKACVAVTDAGKMGSKGPDFLAEDATRAVRKVGEHAVFLMIMDGPAICTQALQLLQRTFPRILMMRSVIYGMDHVLLEIGRRFTHEILAPVHSILVHVTNHPFLFAMFESMDGLKHLLQPTETRLSAEVLCARAFYKDRVAVQMMWNHPNVIHWVTSQPPARGPVKDRHVRLAEDYVNKQDWWRLLEAFVALVESALPILRDGDLDSPNLFKLPQLFEQSCHEVQENLAIQGQELDTRGLVADGGVPIAGRPGDGSVQGAVLQLLRASKDMLVSDVSLAAAMLYPPYVYQDNPYEPEGGRAAFNLVAQRYFSHDEDAHVQALSAFSCLRNKQREFSSQHARQLALTGDVVSFYESVVRVDPSIHALKELAIKLLTSVCTLMASDRSMHESSSEVMQGRTEQQMHIRMHQRLRGQSRQMPTLLQPRNVLMDVRMHWLMQRRYVVSSQYFLCVFGAWMAVTNFFVCLRGMFWFLLCACVRACVCVCVCV